MTIKTETSTIIKLPLQLWEQDLEILRRGHNSFYKQKENRVIKVFHFEVAGSFLVDFKDESIIFRFCLVPHQCLIRKGGDQTGLLPPGL